MARNKQEALRTVESAGVVAVIRASSSEQLVDIGEALLAGGVPAIEVTMTTPNAIAGIERLAKHFGDRAVIGVGTVLDSATARAAIAAGAEFVVSPNFEGEVVATTLELGKISIPGAFTVSEMVRAWNAGADVVKVFPSTAVGPGYFKDVLAPLPKLRLTPTGGVDLKNAGEWILAGAVFVGVGSALVSKEAMGRRDWGGITERAREFVEVVRGARGRG